MLSCSYGVDRGCARKSDSAGANKQRRTAPSDPPWRLLSVADLEAAIEAFLQAWNQHPKPFVWTATVESIQENLTRCRRTLEQIKPGCTSPKSQKAEEMNCLVISQTLLH